MAKFDLKGMLSERSTQEMDLPEQKTVYRNPEDLIPSKDNFYSTEDTEKLKQSIKVLGILQQEYLLAETDACNIIADGSRVQRHFRCYEWSNDRIPESGTVFAENKCRHIPFDVFTDTTEKFTGNCVCTDPDSDSTDPERFY